MTEEDSIDVTMYLVGYDQNDAWETFPFDSKESAQSFADDPCNIGMQVFSVKGKIYYSTIESI